jgi:hypothetical protein
MRLAVVSLVLAGCLCCSPVVRAQDSPRVQEASRLFNAACESLKRGDVERACRAFDQSERLDPQLGTKLHLADCYERLGKLASAWLQFRAAELLAAERNANGSHEPREKVAHEIAEALRVRVPTVQLAFRAHAPESRVTLDGHELAERAWGSPVAMEPGEHEIAVAAKGRVTWRRALEIAERQHIEVVVPPLPQLTERHPPAPPANSASAPQRVVSYSVGTVGLLAIGAGVVLGIVTESTLAKRDKLCPNDVCRDQGEKDRVSELTSKAQGTARATNVLVIGAGFALAAGVTLFLLSPKSSETAVSVGLKLSPTTAGLALNVRGF